MSTERDVAELLAWKKSFDQKQAELIAWQETIMEKLIELNESEKNIIDGCMTMMETDTAISERCDHISSRTDIANKRLRKLEEINRKLQTQMSMIEDAIVNDPRLQDE